MEMDNSATCPWTNVDHRNTTNYAAINYDVMQAPDQFSMDSVCAYPMNYSPEEITPHLQSPQPTDINQELGLLHIPSIQETLSDSFDELDKDSDEFGDVISPRDGDDKEASTARAKPREPLKRMRRQRANDRERRRMKSLNGALNNLKRCIPLPKTKRRVTKLEILRIACHYIQTLWDTLNNGNEGNGQATSRARNAVTNKNVVNGMTVSQRLNLLSNNLNLNFQ